MLLPLTKTFETQRDEAANQRALTTEDTKEHKGNDTQSPIRVDSCSFVAELVFSWQLVALCFGGFPDVTINLKMEPIRSGLRQIMRDFLKTQPPQDAPVLAWPVVCGPEIAARTRALEFTDGLLTVEVPDNTWRHQLAAFTSRYISGFGELLGPVVKEVRFQTPAKTGWPRMNANERESKTGTESKTRIKEE